MKRGEAFAALGVATIGRSQWHKKAADDVQVVSIWEHNIRGDISETHVHKKHFGEFSPGDKVRAVIQRGHWDEAKEHMTYSEAEPDQDTWIVVSKEIRPLEEKRLRQLHVVCLSKSPN